MISKGTAEALDKVQHLFVILETHPGDILGMEGNFLQATSRKLYQRPSVMGKFWRIPSIIRLSGTRQVDLLSFTV